MHTVRPLIHTAIQLEIRQIRCLADLASIAPNEEARDIILRMIMEEAGEASFWNTVDAAYRGIPLPAGSPYPGAPGYGYGMGLYSEKPQDEGGK